MAGQLPAGRALIGTCLLVVLAGCTRHHPAQPSSSSSASSANAAASQSESASQFASQSKEVADALKKLATDPESLIASSSRRQVAGKASQAVPAGSKVVSDEKSWLPDGAGGGVMTVTITPPGKAPVSYAAVMVQENGRWKVLATVPMKTLEQPTSSPSHS